MNIFKFILNSKEPEVSRWDEVKIFLNLMVRPEQCSGIKEITKARKTKKKPHKKLNSRIYMHKHKQYMRRVYSIESRSHNKVLITLVVCSFFFMKSISESFLNYLNIYRWQWSYPYIWHHFSLPCPYSNIRAADLITG